METGKLQNLTARWGLLKSRRSPHEPTWQEIQDLMSPFRGDITTKQAPGAKRTTGLYDTTATLAADQFVNFLVGTMYPKGSDWLRLQHSKEEFAQNQEVQEIMDISSLRILRGLALSNFYSEGPIHTRDFGVIGNGVILAEEKGVQLRDFEDGTFGGLNFRSIPVHEICWAEGRDGRPNFTMREFEMPAIDAYRFFDGNPGEDCKDKIASGNSMELCKFLHAVYRNEKKIPNGLPAKTDLPWVSEYLADYEVGKTPFLVREGGFDYLPYIISRWHRVAGEEYGRGRGHLARPDAKGANEIRRQVLIALGRELNPALMVTSEGSINTRGGSSSIMVVNREPEDMIPQFLHSGTNFQAADEVGRADREQIRRAFLGDVLDEPEAQPRSAAESRMRQQRALQRLAAPASIMETEFLNPLVSVVASIMGNAGALPELATLGDITGEGAEVDIDFQYTSPFFTAQRAGIEQRIVAFLEQTVILAQNAQKPEMLDSIDWDEVIDTMGSFADVPASIFMSEEDVLAMREARAQQATREQTMDTMLDAAAVAKDLGVAGARPQAAQQLAV